MYVTHANRSMRRMQETLILINTGSSRKYNHFVSPVFKLECNQWLKIYVYMMDSAVSAGKLYYLVE
jgi:hypothetical protein